MTQPPNRTPGEDTAADRRPADVAPSEGTSDAGHEDHRYAQRRGEGQDPVQGREYGDIRGAEAQNPDQVIMGGENHSYGGYGTDVARHREEFGGGVAPTEVDRYAPGQPPGHGSGAGAMGQGGGISRPQREGHALAPDEHDGVVQPDGEVRRPD